MATTTAVLSYEQRLARDLEWAMREGSRFFEEKSAVQDALRRITGRLSELGIDYAIAGGMALFMHGFRRFTEDVDILVTPEGLQAIHANLEGRGYRPPFPNSKNLRDTESGVRIEFLVTGQFPGDGRPKPVAFPKPETASIEREGIRLLNLPTLIELKLASGMSSPDRLKDLADVQELIKLFHLPEEYGTQLNPYVRDQFMEQWQAVNAVSKRYVRVWQTIPLTSQVTTLSDVLLLLPNDVTAISEMVADGVTLDLEHSRPAEGYLYLFASDPAIAEKYEMYDESEVWQDREQDND